MATLVLFALFAMVSQLGGEFAWQSLETASPAFASALFLVALIGFGIKAGIMPGHVWLPSAHAMAPSHVSALMSGVLIKTGIYGPVRVTSLLPDPPMWWGGLLLGLGATSAVMGIAFGVGQRDIKRLMAYSSIENIGIIFMGLGLALVGRTCERPGWVVLGMCGALLHVWNHATFKSLLFYGAGAVIHATGTRELERLGGLSKKMPWTATCFLIGAVTICGLPPLAGFVSELALYIGLFQTLGLDGGRAWPAAAFAAPALALTGALAVAAFLKVYGIAFLGAPRSVAAEQAHESPPSMFGPMCLLAAVCVALGLLPQLAAPLLDHAVQAWWPVELRPTPLRGDLPALGALVPLEWISKACAALVALTAGIWLWLKWRLQANEVGQTLTWDCGYAAPTARMQYTSSSFAEILVKMFGWALLPRVQRPNIERYFLAQADFSLEVPDTVLSRAIVPLFRFFAWLFSWLRLMQQENIHAYLLYILIVVVALLMWR